MDWKDTIISMQRSMEDGASDDVSSEIRAMVDALVHLLYEHVEHGDDLDIHRELDHG